MKFKLRHYPGRLVERLYQLRAGVLHIADRFVHWPDFQRPRQGTAWARPSVRRPSCRGASPAGRVANVASWHKASSLDVRSHASCWRRSGHGSARVKPTLLTYTCQLVDEFAAMRSACIGPHKKACCGGGVSL